MAGVPSSPALAEMQRHSFGTDNIGLVSHVFSNIVALMPQDLPHLNPVHLAAYVLAVQGPMSHLKLQKLIYYVEAWHLALYDQTLIDDDFKAWVHGPVCLDVWHAVKKFSVLSGEVRLKSGEAEKAKQRVEKLLTKDQKQLIADVLEEYGGKSAHYLECLTHAEQPWIEARAGIPDDQPSTNKMSKATMRRFYRSRLR